MGPLRTVTLVPDTGTVGDGALGDAHIMNTTIIDSLAKVAEVYRSTGVVYRYKAYRTAIDTIKGLDFEIKSVDQVKGLKGIGKGMVDKIAELLSTGALQQEKDVTSDPVNKALRLFTSVHGIGPVLAKQLVEQGHRTLEDLAGAHLPPAARMGLAHYEDGKERIPFDEVEGHLTHLRTLLHGKVDAALIPVVCGSHRRLGPTSGDVDALLTHPMSHSRSESKYVYLKLAIKALRDAGYVTDVLAEGDTKFMGYVKLPGEGSKVRRLDVRWVTFDQFPPAVMYFTGSDMFNVAMRADAQKLGYTLNEYRLMRTSDGSSLPISSERDIFTLLGRPYVRPVDRSK